MIKNILTTTLLLSSSLFASAEAEILRITFSDGSSQTLKVADIREMTFEDEESNSNAESFSGRWTGTVSLNVGGAFTYTAEIPVTVTANTTDETISVTYPQYYLSGTMMGDITLGELTIDSLEWDNERGGFFRSYGGQGITQHFKAEQNGNTTMDSDYPLNEPSTILVTMDADGKLTINNPFTLGAMPMPLTQQFGGIR